MRPSRTVITEQPTAPAPRRSRWLPFGDPSRGRRLLKVGAWLAGIAVVVAVLGLFGVDVPGWFESLWDALTGIGFGYLVAGWYAADGADHSDRPRLVLHPAGGLSATRRRRTGRCSRPTPPASR